MNPPSPPATELAPARRCALAIVNSLTTSPYALCLPMPRRGAAHATIHSHRVNSSVTEQVESSMATPRRLSVGLMRGGTHRTTWASGASFKLLRVGDRVRVVDVGDQDLQIGA